MVTYKRKGRGAVSNATGRFEQIQVEYDDDVFSNPKTTFYKDATKKIITTNDSPDLSFGQSVNPYRGCEHGCIYCYARPTHEYLGFSAGVDFETKIMVKENAPQLLRKELMAKNYKPDTLVFSGVTDCYQPAEKKFQLTRKCLEVCAEFKNPFAIITKNHLITRDIDVIAPMSEIGCAMILVSVTTLDPKLAGVMEPRASCPELRLDAIRQLAQAGVRVGVNIAPVISGLTDHEMPNILDACFEAGVKFANFTVVRLPFSVKDLFQEWIDQHFPDRKNKILNRMKSMRGGKLYDSTWGTRMRGEGEFAELIQNVFEQHCRKLGLNEERKHLNIKHFSKPGAQMTLEF